MSSLHQSRTRILFDAACAFGISASCAWAWVETYAVAMVPAAAIAGLWGVVRLFDMAPPHPVEKLVAEPARPAESIRTFELPPVEWAPVAVADPESDQPAVEPVVEAKAKPARKPSRSKGRKNAEKAETESVVPDATLVMTADSLPEVASEPVVHAIAEPEPDYAPVTPLFEAEPFVRQQRAAFGRRKFG